MMQRTRVKICGITRVEDAVAAASAGADAIGMVMFEGAKRRITTDRAREIIAALPPFVTPVALFVDETPQRVLDTAAELNIRHVQLHGEESPDDVAELVGLTVIKALRVQRESFLGAIAHWKNAIRSLDLKHLSGFVLDSGHPGQLGGGTGIENDWSTIESARGELADLPAIIVAGGLTSENVSRVVRGLEPYAVDVSSGVESELGLKDAKKIEMFIRAVREASAA